MAPWGYRALLHVLPREFRREFGDEMCDVVQEQRRSLASPAMGARVRFWARQSYAVVRESMTLRLGGVPVRRRQSNRRRSGPMDGLVKDARHAVRSFRRHPGFAAITILTLGLGIGATTTIFSAVQAVLFRPLPYADSERVAVVFQTNSETGERGRGTSAANMRDLGESAERLAYASVAEPWSLDLQHEDRAESLRTWAVSAGFFETIGTSAMLGRTFLADEYVAGNEKVVLLGHQSWLSRFGADRSIVGQVLTLNNEPYQVVGVLPPKFRFPDRAELWIPRPEAEYDQQSRSADFMTGIVRLAPGVSLTQAEQDVDRVAGVLAQTYPQSNARIGFDLVPLRGFLLGDVRTPLLVLFGSVGFVLLIACANVAGLMLARGAQRQREYALRSALGAGKGRLFAHVTMESLVLALAGCALGVALTYVGVGIVQSLGPDHLPRIDELSIDGSVLIFAVACAGLSALLAGLVPSAQLSRPDLRGTLSESTRGTLGSRRGRILRKQLVVVEVACAVVLLIGAGLLFKSFAVLLDEDLGFDPANRVAIQVFAYDGYADAAARANFVNASIANMEAIPGVDAVALTTSVPSATDATIASIDIDAPFVIDGRVRPPDGQAPLAATSSVSQRFFEVMDIPLVAGRAFDERDHRDAPPVIVVNEALVRRHFSDEDPVGKKLTTLGYGRGVTREIVGVVRDTRPFGHASEPRPEIFFPLGQLGSGSLTFVIQTRQGIDVPLPALSQAIWDANPRQSVWGVATLEALLGDWLKERRFNLLLLGAFAGIALILALVGIYGLISYSVQQRMGEMGIRRALGGRTSDIVTMILREGALLAGAGVLIGVAGALLLTRFIQGMLFGVQPIDPATFGLLSVVMLGVAALAALVPAMRAVRADPMAALRIE